MVFVTDLGAHCAHTYPIHHLTGVTVVPAEWKGTGKVSVQCISLVMTNCYFSFHLHNAYLYITNEHNIVYCFFTMSTVWSFPVF